MSFNLTQTGVDAQMEYCDAVKGRLAVYDEAHDLTLSFNKIFTMKAFVFRAATVNLPPKHHKTIPHAQNPSK